MKVTLRLFVRALAFLLVACVLSGCTVVFLNPLSSPQDATPDKRLLGKWVAKEKKNSGVYLQVDREPNGEMRISSFGGENTEQDSPFTMFTTRLGRHYYMNLNATDEDRGKGYLIAKYAVRGDELTVWILDADKVKSAITQGKIKGQPGGRLGITTISDSPEKIASLLEGSGGNHFIELFGNFERVNRK